jgi:hypothetical protein
MSACPTSGIPSDVCTCIICKPPVPRTDYAAMHAEQAAVCKKHGWPHFAPRVCWSCRKEVYSHPDAAAKARTGHVTGCSHCHRSYCD